MSGKNKPEKYPRVWDPIIQPFPPICYIPPIWEIIINSKVDPQELEDLIRDDPVPIIRRENMLKYFDKRIKFTQTLIERGLLDEKIGNAAINHFKNHIEEVSGTPVPIPIP